MSAAIIGLLHDAVRSGSASEQEAFMNRAGAMYNELCGTWYPKRTLTDVLKLECLPYAYAVSCAGLIVDKRTSPERCWLF
ncbi:MAG: hypothetical protein JWO36_3768 [Myxococcales bacterium]|nr:hypothetical protein [Myxococcales bacterium]